MRVPTVALMTWARSASFKASAAQLSGTLLLILGLGVLLGGMWRLVMGSHAEGRMMGITFVALVVNATVLRLACTCPCRCTHLSYRCTVIDVTVLLA